MTIRHLALLAATCLLAVAPASAQESPGMLRVLSFNLRYINSGDTGTHTWTARRDFVAELIKKDDPDLIGFQEALRPMLDDLDARLPGYVEIGCGREDGITKGEAAAIFVKADRFTIQNAGNFWLSDTPDVVNSKSWGNRVVRICTWTRLLDRKTGKELHYFNTHMDHESQLARENGMDLILKRISERTPAGPFILTGDFNAGEDNPVQELIRHNPLAPFDVWKTLHPDTPASESGTFHDFKGVTDGDRIDYIYASNDFTGFESAIMHETKDGMYPSDHFPLRATIRYK
jgi:endonuclease/exonuclease/phosphatase family metal-dependent hydrolase